MPIVLVDNWNPISPLFPYNIGYEKELQNVVGPRPHQLHHLSCLC